MLEGEVEGLAFGGQGIIRSSGLVVFVPFSAPGDRIRYQILRKKKSFAEGELTEILEKSPFRITPHCPYFGTCGGCQLQHLAYEAQLEYKRQSVEDALKRIGHLVFEPVLPTIPARQWGYRRHITLTLTIVGHHFEAGYITVDNESVIKIDSCPIFIDSPQRIIPHVQEMASRLECLEGNEGKVSIFKQDNEQFILHFQFNSLPKNCVEIFKNSLNSFCTGILVDSPKKTLSWGKVEGILEIEGMKFHFSPKMFIQNHPEQSLNIYRQIRKIAATLGAQKVLDLYCGIGISSLILAKQHLQVTGVESNQYAINYARKNAKTNEMNNLNFIHADVQKVLPELLKELDPDVVIVNPPRAGLDQQVIQSLIEKPPSAILYISCMPSTLARDLQILCNKHFKLSFVQPYDMFPQTAHVEILSVLNRLPIF